MRVWGRVVILLVSVLGLLWNSISNIASIHAQDEIVLERLFVSSDSNFAFFYPSSWKVQRTGPASLLGDAQDVQAAANKQAPKSLTLRIVGGDSAAFKLGPSDDLPALMDMIHPANATGAVAKFRLAARDALRADLAAGSDVVVRVGNDRWMTLTAMGTPGHWQDNAALFEAILQTFTFEVMPITYSAKVKKTFGPLTQPFIFTFDAQSGDTVTLTMAADPGSPALDPAVMLYGPDGSLVAQNDDALDSQFGMTNARLVRFPIADKGSYAIRAERRSAESGDFTLSLRATRAQP